MSKVVISKIGSENSLGYEEKTYEDATFCFIALVWIKMYVIIFAVFLVVEFEF